MNLEEYITISQLEKVTNKYSGNLQIQPWDWSNTFDLKIHNGLLLARVDYFDDSDLIAKIIMPIKYRLYFSTELNCRNIGSYGLFNIKTLDEFENQTRILLENYKKCLVEQRKDFLENDFK